MWGRCQCPLRASLRQAEGLGVWGGQMDVAKVVRLPKTGSPPFVLMAVSGKALAAGPEQKRNPRLAPCGSLDTKFNTNGGEPNL